MSKIISWVHFGDLHIRSDEYQNYRDFLSLIGEANRFQAGMEFGLLPGDNADDGEEDEYALVKEAIGICRFPVYAIPGDHDIASGNLDLFGKYLSKELHWSFTANEVHFVFLNSVCNWNPPAFGLGPHQMAWLRRDLAAATGRGEKAVVFMHAYPSEHSAEASELRTVLRDAGVLLVEMGHTHYNELASDGQTIYAATPSTGQIEEGPPGFSIGTIDDGVVSWIFKPIGQSAVAMITSPSDERLIVDPSNPSQLVRGSISVRARVWGEGIRSVAMSLNGISRPMQSVGDGCTWIAEFNSTSISDGVYDLDVTAASSDCEVANDRVRILVSQQGSYEKPSRRPVDYENALGAWPEKHILGTQLGPNENGHAWPSRHDAERPLK